MVNHSLINCGLRPYPRTAHHPPIVCGCVFCCCVRAFFWIGYRIIEFIGHLSFCKNIYILFFMRILKKNGALFFSFFLWGYKKKEIYILPKKKKKKKRKKKVVIGI